MSTLSRTANLGILDLPAQCHEGPAWGSCAAATVILAKVGFGPSLPDDRLAWVRWSPLRSEGRERARCGSVKFSLRALAAEFLL